MKKNAAKIPSVLTGWGSLFIVLFAMSFSYTMAFLFGFLIQSVWISFTAGSIGAFVGIGYFIFKPLNPFAENRVVSKSLLKMTSDELRGLSYLNSSKGRFDASMIAIGVVLAQTFGGVTAKFCVMMGIVEGIGELDKLSDKWATFGLALIVSATCAGLVYPTSICRILLKRWHWILEHQTLPSRQILLKYAKGRARQRIDRLYQTPGED